MKTIQLFCIIALFSVSVTGWATEYKKGSYTCDLEESRKDYKEHYDGTSYEIFWKYRYAVCLSISGNENQGLPMLYHMADHESIAHANYFIARYLSTDGKLDGSTTEKNIDEALKYYFRSLAIMDLTYPDTREICNSCTLMDFDDMEIHSFLEIVDLYLQKFSLGHGTMYMEHQYQLPSYEGEREPLNTKYKGFARDSLSKVVEYAGKCATFPNRQRTSEDYYQIAIKVCSLWEEAAKAMIPLEEELQQGLLNCEGKELDETNCPEYRYPDDELHEIQDNTKKAIDGIWQTYRNSGTDQDLGGEYIDGKKHGHWINKQSDLIEEGPYVNGEKHGRWIIKKYRDGKLYTTHEGQFVNGKEQGVWKGQYHNVDWNGSWTQSYVNGLLHGKWTTYNPDGSVARTGRNANGKTYETQIDGSEICVMGC